MNGLRTQIKIPPVKSSALSDFSIDTNVCRNPACDNFGISEENIQSAKVGYDYKINDGVLKHVCKRCKQTHLRPVVSNILCKFFVSILAHPEGRALHTYSAALG